METGKKLSQKKFGALILVPLAILLVLGIVLNAAAVLLKSTFDQFLGAGEKTVVSAGDLDGLYYEQKYADA